MEPTQLESPAGDTEGMLARRHGRLIAVLSCLGAIHGELLGHWYVESTFATDLVSYGQVFATLDQFEEYVTQRDG